MGHLGKILTVLYLELLASNILVLGGPLFPTKTVLRLLQGDLSLIGHGTAKAAPYVRSMRSNDQPCIKLWTRFFNIFIDADLVYTPGSSSTNWGSILADAFPSYGAQKEFHSEK